MKIGLITDNFAVTDWQVAALRELGPDIELIVYNCTNSRPFRPKLRHALYYLLNLISIRNRYARKGPVRMDAGLSRLDFAAEEEGNWQRLPRQLLEEIRRNPPSVIVKFGMGLLRVPAHNELPVPILSYHHGDPRQFRGRPAGFYELVQDLPTMGQIVQVLSNRLDAGKVVAFAETKVHSHSYKATLEEAYRHSKLLLPKAIENSLTGISLPMESAGRAYSLPSNLQVIALSLKLFPRKLRRAAYGAFVEKRWAVVECPVALDVLASGDVQSALPHRSWREVPLPSGYRFIADPFFHPDGGLIVEALDCSTNMGAILHIRSDETTSMGMPPLHCSYPATISEHDVDFLVPEIAEWSRPKIFRIVGSRLEEAGELRIPGNPRLIDPTPYQRDGTIFLFGNILEEGSSVLRLWFADSLFGRFTEHPLSPIRISPAGSRMGGSVLHCKGREIRIGQDFSRQYGDGIILFKIEALDCQEYRESEMRRTRFTCRRGPHTLNLSGRNAVFDCYVDRFSVLAGVRRFNQLRAQMARPRRS